MGPGLQPAALRAVLVDTATTHHSPGGDSKPDQRAHEQDAFALTRPLNKSHAPEASLGAGLGWPVCWEQASKTGPKF